MQPILSLALPFIKTHEVIYVPKLLSEWNSEGNSKPLPNSQLKFIDANYILRKESFDPKYVELIRTMVSIRVISDLPLNINKSSIFCGMEQIFKTTQPLIERIIVHIHGGGFISMSSRSHQTYTRKWAKETKSVIFSIDYRLAPEDPFPAAIEDVWQAYYWIITQAPKYLNVVPKKVVVTGDSAGGNMTAALTLKCIKENFRIPDGILMGYPGISMNSPES